MPNDSFSQNKFSLGLDIWQSMPQSKSWLCQWRSQLHLWQVLCGFQHCTITKCKLSRTMSRYSRSCTTTGSEGADAGHPDGTLSTSVTHSGQTNRTPHLRSYPSTTAYQPAISDWRCDSNTSVCNCNSLKQIQLLTYQAHVKPLIIRHSRTNVNKTIEATIIYTVQYTLKYKGSFLVLIVTFSWSVTMSMSEVVTICWTFLISRDL